MASRSNMLVRLRTSPSAVSTFCTFCEAPAIIASSSACPQRRYGFEAHANNARRGGLNIPRWRQAGYPSGVIQQASRRH